MEKAYLRKEAMKVLRETEKLEDNYQIIVENIEKQKRKIREAQEGKEELREQLDLMMNTLDQILIKVAMLKNIVKKWKVKQRKFARRLL